MFDSVLDRAAVPPRRLGTGAALSVIAHALLVAGALYLSSQPTEADTKETDVVFFSAVPSPPPPPLPKGGGSPQPKIEPAKPKPAPRPDTIYDSKELPKEPPKEAPQELVVELRRGARREPREAAEEQPVRARAGGEHDERHEQRGGPGRRYPEGLCRAREEPIEVHGPGACHARPARPRRMRALTGAAAGC